MPDGPQPFVAVGGPHHLLTAEQLAQYIPRAPKTLRLWALQGVIPALRLPNQGRGKKVPLLFDLPAVYEALRAYRQF